MSIRGPIHKPKLDDLIYEDYVKYHVDNRVFSYSEYRDMVLRDPDQVNDLVKRKDKGKNNV